jgi:hypothetical protein
LGGGLSNPPEGGTPNEDAEDLRPSWSREKFSGRPEFELTPNRSAYMIGTQLTTSESHELFGGLAVTCERKTFDDRRALWPGATCILRPILQNEANFPGGERWPATAAPAGRSGDERRRSPGVYPANLESILRNEPNWPGVRWQVVCETMVMADSPARGRRRNEANFPGAGGGLPLSPRRAMAYTDLPYGRRPWWRGESSGKGGASSAHPCGVAGLSGGSGTWRIALKRISIRIGFVSSKN